MKMFINGIPTDAADGKTIDVINPATGAVVDTVPAATKEDVDAAVDYAKKAQPVWAIWHRHCLQRPGNRSPRHVPRSAISASDSVASVKRQSISTARHSRRA